MTYTATQLITSAFYASGVVSRDFESLEGRQAADGLIWLNEIISELIVNETMIPYESTYQFDGVIGQEEYFIPDLIQIDTLTFTKDSVRYPMVADKRNQYFGSPRSQNINSLPFVYFAERVYGGTKIFMYFKPDETYQFDIHGIFRLKEVSATTDLTARQTQANLGIATVAGTGAFSAGELVVNDVDLAGTYATPTALVNYINTGVVEGVTASLSGLEFILTSVSNPFPKTIYIDSNGTMGTTNNVNFANFSTIDGENHQSWRVCALERYYIAYLKYKLANKICAEYNFSVPPGVIEQLNYHENLIDKRSRKVDLRNTKLSTLDDGRGSINYADVNIGRGWTTG